MASYSDDCSRLANAQAPAAQQVEVALAELSDALDFLHGGAWTRSAIIRRDIKPANTLGHRGHFMLADLGLARRLNESFFWRKLKSIIKQKRFVIRRPKTSGQWNDEEVLTRGLEETYKVPSPVEEDGIP
ncbi:hypothetical protein V8E36_008231 [Tilletia maclaganii]